MKRFLGMKEMKCKDIESEDIKVLKKVSQCIGKVKGKNEQLSKKLKKQMSNEVAPVMVPIEMEMLRQNHNYKKLKFAVCKDFYFV